MEVGEYVKQAVGTTATGTDIIVRGEVIDRTKSSDTISQISVGYIEVTNSDGKVKEFIASNSIPLVGETSGFTSYITKVYGLTDTTQTFDTDGGAQNVDFETFADGFIDFSETNPFGDPSETF